jgi:hypothetical protein
VQSGAWGIQCEDLDGEMNEKIKAVLTAVIIVVGYFSLEAAIRQARTPGAQRRKAFVVKEMGAIHDPPGVKRNKAWSNFEVRTGRARQPFTSDIDYDKTRDFYRGQLEANGWRFVCESAKDGKNRLIFSRDEYFAVLELPEYSEQMFPPHARYSYSFAFAIEVEWGTVYYC